MATVVPMPLGTDDHNPAPAATKMSLRTKSTSFVGGKAKGTSVDITQLPPEVQAALAELDADGSGSLDVSEIHSAVQLLKSSRESAKRAHLYVLVLLALLGVLLAALLGVSYAAAVLAATTKGSGGALQDVNGNTLRTAGAAIGSVDTGFDHAVVSNGRRLHTLHDDDIPADFFGHRRTRSFVQQEGSGGGRRLAVATENEEDKYKPKPLVRVATMRGRIAQRVCDFAAEGHYSISIPGFDPYDQGIERVIATFKPGTMFGCGELDHPFGFASDFTVTFATGQAEAIFHVDCPGPVTKNSECSVNRVFIVVVPPDWSAANDNSFSTLGSSSAAESNETALDPESAPRSLHASSLSTTVEDSTNATQGRSLQTSLGWSWPPSASVAWTASEDKCPTLTWTTGFPERSNYGDDSDVTWKNAVLDALGVGATSSPGQFANALCQTSPFCMVGYAVASGWVFKKDFWTTGFAVASTMAKSIATDFKKSMSLSNQKAMWNGFKSTTSTKCTTYTQAASCCGLRKVPSMKADGTYTCNEWNVNNFREGAFEIASMCVNACEMLQWYTSWWRNYRVSTNNRYPASHNTAKYPLNQWHNGTIYPYWQDYCGVGAIKSYDKGYWGGYLASDHCTSTPQYAYHTNCWKGQKIPTCRSVYYATKTTC